MQVTWFVVLLFAFASAAPGNTPRPQSCNPAVVSYLVRDENGHLLNAVEVKTLYEQLPKALGTTQTYVNEVSFKADGQSYYWPEDADWTLGRKVPALSFANAATCAMHLTEITLTYQRQKMRLIFKLEVTRTQPDRRLVIDSLPFQTGVFELDWQAWPRHTDQIIPAESWKKVEAERN